MKEYGKDNKYDGKESSLQASCYKIVKHIPGNPLVFHVANERKTSTIRAKNGKYISPRGMALRAQGVLSGVPDLIIPHARGKYHGLAVELKVKGGSLSDEQKYVLDWFAREGWFTAVCWSLDGFLELREEYWGLMKGGGLMGADGRDLFVD